MIIAGLWSSYNFAQIYTGGMLTVTQEKHKTTLRKGWEVSGEILPAYFDGYYIGANALVNYRIVPEFAIGIGMGYHDWDSGKDASYLIPIFVNGIVNFTKTKWSPFVSVDVGYGFGDVFLGEEYYFYSEGDEIYSYYNRYSNTTSFYLGIAAGVQHSFNENLALKVSIKTSYPDAASRAAFGSGLSLLYHF